MNMHTDTVDYLFDMTGPSSYERAYVMANRPDCPIDLEGLTSYERALVMDSRPDCSPDQNL